MLVEVPLLSMLDARVRTDGAPPGFTGTLCVVVRTASREIIWSASFGDRARCGVVDRVPEDAQSVLLLGEREAESIVRSGALPPPPRLLAGAGNRELMDRFLARYVEFRDLLDVRANGARSPR